MENIIRKALSEITIPEGRRGIDHAKVRELADSIMRIGKLLHPIGIDRNDVLVYGGHRLEAYKFLGFDEIDCVMLDGNDWQIELAEVDENLMRKDLDPISIGEHANKRNEILDAMRLRAQPGDNQHTNGGSANFAPPQTTESIAKEAGMSERTLQERKQIARNLVPAAKEAVRKIDASKGDMMKLSRKTPAEQNRLAKIILDGEATTLAKAIALPVPTPDWQTDFSGLTEEQRQENRRQERGFCKMFREQHPLLLNSKGIQVG